MPTIPRATEDGLPVVAPDWLDELRLEPGPPYQTMGTRALDPAAWLVADERRDGELARKRELLRIARNLVAGASTPDARPACEEALALVAGFVGEAAPGLDDLPVEDDDAVAPLVRAALLVQDDLAVMQEVDGEWILSAAVVCFPSHWTPADKLGLPLGLVHSPVAHYERELAEKVDRFHDRLAVERPAWRRNWSVNPTSELHLPDRGVVPPIAREPGWRIAEDGTPMWIRSERQTLRRLPATGAVLFTIRVQLAPLGVLLDRPDLAARLLACVESWDDTKRAYNSTGGALDQLVAWLRAQRGPVPS